MAATAQPPRDFLRAVEVTVVGASTDVKHLQEQQDFHLAVVVALGGGVEQSTGLRNQTVAPEWNQRFWFDVLPQDLTQPDAAADPGLVLTVRLQERTPLPVYDYRRSVGESDLPLGPLFQAPSRLQIHEPSVPSALAERPPDVEEEVELWGADGQLTGVVHCLIHFHYYAFNRLALSCLTVTVEEAHLAAEATVDPYCLLGWHDHEPLRTATVRNSNAPVWRAPFRVPVSAAGQLMVHFHVRDAWRFGGALLDTTLGEGRLDAGQLPLQAGPVGRWVQLVRDHRAAGTLHVTVTAEFGKPERHLSRASDDVLLKEADRNTTIKSGLHHRLKAVEVIVTEADLPDDYEKADSYVVLTVDGKTAESPKRPGSHPMYNWPATLPVAADSSMTVAVDLKRTFLMVGSRAVGQFVIDLTKMGWTPGQKAQTSRWLKAAEGDVALRLSLSPVWYSFNRSHLSRVQVTVESCAILAKGYQEVGAKFEPWLRIRLGSTTLHAPVPTQSQGAECLDYEFEVLPSTDLTLRLRLMDNWRVADFQEGEAFLDLGALPLQSPVRTRVMLANADGPAADLELLVTAQFSCFAKESLQALSVVVLDVKDSTAERAVPARLELTVGRGASGVVEWLGPATAAPAKCVLPVPEGEPLLVTCALLPLEDGRRLPGVSGRWDLRNWDLQTTIAHRFILGDDLSVLAEIEGLFTSPEPVGPRKPRKLTYDPAVLRPMHRRREPRATSPPVCEVCGERLSDDDCAGCTCHKRLHPEPWR
eukprot:EG_transcript_3390